VIAVALGPVARLISPHGLETGIMTVLPMSLIPTFVVPLLIMLHVICIVQARKWKEQPHSHGVDRLPASV